MKNWLKHLRRLPGAAPDAEGEAAETPSVEAAVPRPPLPGLEAALEAAMLRDGAPVTSGRQVDLRLAALRALELLPPVEDDHRVASEFRGLKRIVLGHLEGRTETPVPGGNLIMVTSALPNEGKTLCTLNLALALSLERDYSVVLVDGDVINPTISRAVGLEAEPGLLDVLRTPDTRLADVEIATHYPRLSVIPAGRRDQDAPELLSSRRMAQFAREMESEPNRLYLFDSTPILLTNESRALSEIVGQILFVVRSGVSQRVAVRTALTFLPQGEGTFVGLVLNQKGSVQHGDDYYYGYYPAESSPPPA